MTLCEIKKRLKELDPEISGINDPGAAAIISDLLAIIESCCSTTDKLTAAVQQQRNEINRLKGEHGKANIKANADGSTEKERRAAEEALKAAPAIGFRLTKEKLKTLGENRLPPAILEALEGISNKKFSSESEFMKAVSSAIGQDEADLHRKLLLKYGRYKKRNRKSKVSEIIIDRTEICKVDPEILPEDAYLNGHEDNIVQDIIIKRDNVKFQKEVYYSPSQHKTFAAKVPPGYEGGFGPYIKTEIVCMKYVNNMSEPKILEALRSLGAIISPTYISDRLTSPIHMKPFIDEKEDLFRAAVEAASYVQIDDTGCRVNGTNHYVQILCNHLFTAFFTVHRKDRLTVLDILRNFRKRAFIFNDDTFRFLEIFNVSNKTINRIRSLTDARDYDGNRLQELLTELFPDAAKGKNTRIRITEAAAIAHYHQDHDYGVVNILVADDAPQFKHLVKFLALCWVHIGRHFKKLNPLVPKFQDELKRFQTEFWIYYGKLLKFQKNPLQSDIKILEDEFDSLFSIQTGYPELDKRIEITRNKKKELLVVLEHPEIPLHNNRSENGARIQKRREDVSLQTKSKDGTIAKDAMMSTVATCNKLKINSRSFIRDRLFQTGEIPLLGSIIRSLSS